MITRSKVLLILLASMIGVSAWALMPPDDECVYTGQGFVQINIFYNSTTTFAAPPIKSVAQGGVIKFHLAGPPGVDFTVLGDPPSVSWLKGSGNTTTDKFFFVCVPDDAIHRRDYKYHVDTSISPLLDPVVRILN